jgi:hypothetical protein
MYKSLDKNKYSNYNSIENENCHIISRKRADTSPESIIIYRFIGYIIIPYKKNINYKHDDKRLNELYVFIFEDDYGIYLFDSENGIIEKEGYVYRSQTILVSEIKALYKYFEVDFYYDPNLPDYIFLSTKPENELKAKYNNLIKLKMTDKHSNVSLLKKTHGKIRENQILLYYDIDINNRRNILQSIDKSDIEFKVTEKITKGQKLNSSINPHIKQNNPIIMSAGSNNILCYEKLEKIIKYRKEIQKRYFSNNRMEFQKFINDNYLISKYQYPFTKKYISTNSKYFSIEKNKKNITIDFNKLLNNDTTEYVYKYYPYTFGYYRSYEIVYNDILNFKNKTIAEISTLPSFFEVFKKLLNKKIDLYLTDRNYYCVNNIEWQKLISIYKNKISNNILYNLNINKKYDILIINLLLYVKQEYIPKDLSINTSEYMLKYIHEEDYNTNMENLSLLINLLPTTVFENELYTL